ncbi:MAG: hypothetical protein CM15mV135_060 [uncultured marine virus]|nr:MAG: hypothetical protein CM15mV135_060 [uncultured marine virus]
MTGQLVMTIQTQSLICWQKNIQPFLYRNRLGFLAGDSVVLSKAGDFLTSLLRLLFKLLPMTPLISLLVPHVLLFLSTHVVPVQVLFCLVNEISFC